MKIIFLSLSAVRITRTHLQSLTQKVNRSLTSCQAGLYDLYGKIQSELLSYSQQTFKIRPYGLIAFGVMLVVKLVLNSRRGQNFLKRMGLHEHWQRWEPLICATGKLVIRIIIRHIL